jgi:NADH-quinone oxidoreductase subunit N
MIAPELSAAAASPGATALADAIHLGPMIVVGLWSLFLLVSDAFAGVGFRGFQRRIAVVGLAIAGTWAATQFGTLEYDAGVSVFGGFLSVDHFSTLLDLGVLVIAAGVITFAGDYARTHRFEYGEHESLVLIAAFGMMVLNHATDLVAVFLGIETMSIAIYVLVGARWNLRASSEAALKYFIMGAFASGVLLMGIALLYGATGTTNLDQLASAVAQVFTQWGAAQPYVELVMQNEAARMAGEALPPPEAVRAAVDKSVTGMAPAALFIPGLFLLLAGMLFKVSAVPFHMWTPDAYDGAPSPTTGFMAAGVKIGGFAALLKVFVGSLATQRLATAPYGWTSIVAVVALLSMTVGNFAAVRQANVKRMLAYSSIAHVGYLLVGVVAAANFYGHAYAIGSMRPADQIEWSRNTGDFSVAAVLFYVLTYAVSTLGAFACVSWFGSNKTEASTAHEWSGLAQRHPGMALGMTVCLLSLMGMPPTVGFFGKVGLFRAALENDNLMMRVLVIAALLNSVVGAYYYLRLIVAMYFRPPTAAPVQPLGGSAAPAVVAICATAAIALGVLADPAFRRAELAAAGFPHAAGSAQREARVDKLRTRWEDAELAAEAKADDAKAGEAKAGEAKAGEAKSGEAKAGEAKAGEAKAGEAKAGEAKAGEAKAIDAKAAEAKVREAKAGDAKAPGARPVVNPIDVKVPDVKAADAKAADAKAADAKADAKAADAKADAKAGDAKPGDTKAPPRNP